MCKQFRKIFNNKKGKHVPYTYSMLALKKFCAFFGEHAASIIKFEKKTMLPLTKKEIKLHQDATVSYMCGKRFIKMFAKDKNY